MEKVEALDGQRVLQVSCGSRDAQTLALVEGKLPNWKRKLIFHRFFKLLFKCFLGGLVYSWGDGDFGKLGRGKFTELNFCYFLLLYSNWKKIVDKIQPIKKFVFIFSRFEIINFERILLKWIWIGNVGGSEGCSVPVLIDKLSGLGVCHVECGAQFSVALTSNGHVTSFIHFFIHSFIYWIYRFFYLLIFIRYSLL